MKLKAYPFLLLLVFAASDAFAQHHQGGMFGNGSEKDPVIAALLSIQPVPVAIGNFYAGNWERGIIYTTAELALFIPAAVLLGRNNWGWGMHNYSPGYTDNSRSWTNSEQNRFYYFLTGYILVKIISAFDAGYSAEIFNQNLSMQYDVLNNSAEFSLNIPL